MKRVFPLIVVGCLTGADPKPMERDVQRELEGMWMVTAKSTFGEAEKPAEVARWKRGMEFRGDQFHMHELGMVSDEGTFAIDCSTTPMRMVMTTTLVKGKPLKDDNTARLLFDLSGDELRLAYLFDNMKQKQIDPKSESQVVWTMKRKK